jgi:Amidohydrolase family
MPFWFILMVCLRSSTGVWQWSIEKQHQGCQHLVRTLKNHEVIATRENGELRVWDDSIHLHRVLGTHSFPIADLANKKSLRRSALLLVLSLAISTHAGRAETTLLAIKGATLVDVHTGRRIGNSAILVEKDRIKEVGDASNLRIPTDARVIDAHGKWVIPGLIDMHVHGSSRKDVPIALYVANGITAIRDMGGNVTSLRMTRQRIESGETLGPHLFYTGNVLDGSPPVVPPMSFIVDSPQEAKGAVEFLISQGADSIKIYNNITEPVLDAIVKAAKRAGKPVGGHVPKAMSLKRSLELGFNFVEHSAIRSRDLLEWNSITQAEANEITSLRSVTQREALVWQQVDLDSPKLKAVISFMAEKDVFLDPTLSIDEFDSLFLYEKEAKHPNNRYLKRTFVEEALGPDHDIFRMPAELKAVAVAGIEKRRKFVGMCNRAGVKILAGTDGPGIGRLTVGFGLHHELALLVEAGLKPIEALQGATINAARALRKANEIGSLEPGKFADMVILNSDPLSDVHNTTKIDAVLLRGRMFDRTTLDATLAEIEADAKKDER